MNILEYILLSLRSLRTNKVRSLLTMLGIIIGVASVILLVSIGTGLQAYITNQFASLGSNKIYVLPGKVDLKSMNGGPRMQVSKFELADVSAVARAGESIADVTPAVVSTGIPITYQGEIVSTEIQGVWENYFTMMNFEAAEGSLLTQNDVERARKSIVLGSKPAKELFGDVYPVGKYVNVGEIRYQVKGVLVSKGGGMMGDIDDAAYLPLTTALRQFNQQRPYMLVVESTSEKNVEEAAELTKRALSRRLKEDDFTVIQQTELLNTITQFLGVITVALGGIAAISLLVGGIGIMNIMLVSVTERTREIGLRKAVGATGRDILLQFLIESIILSLVGGAMGIALGAAGSAALRAFVETQVTLWSVVLASGFSAGIGIAFGVAPAIRAARLDPIVALRYE